MAAEERRTIDMSCDYGADWPLWADGMTDGESLGLSPALAQKLLAWNDYYLAHARPNQSWLVSKESDARWLEEGRRLSEHLRAELRGVADVTFTQR